MDWKFGNQLNCLNGILLQRSDLLKPKCTLCCFSSVTRGFLIKILGLLLRGKILGHLESMKLRKKQYCTMKSFKKKGQCFSQDAITAP